MLQEFILQTRSCLSSARLSRRNFQTHITFIWRGYVYTYKYINIYNKITQVDSTCGYVGRLPSHVVADIYRLASSVFCICIFLRMFLSVCAYVCVTSVSVLPSVGSLVKRARKCLTDCAAVTIAPRSIIEETLMYIANYQK